MRVTAMLLAFFLLCIQARATNYYLSSSSGDDSRTALQAQNPATPWKSIQKLNSFFASLQPGDSVLFKRGDTFYGSVEITRSGNAYASIVLSAYGTGAKPVITGFTQLGSWTSKGGGVYETTTTLPNAFLRMVTVNQQLQPMGRYPNSDAPDKGYLSFESALTSGSTVTAITDNELPSSPNWTGAEVVARLNHWVIGKSTIAAHLGSTLSFTSAIWGLTWPKFGYFIQNDIRTLDQMGEWYYNPLTKKLSMFFGAQSPSQFQVQAATVEDLVVSNRQSYVSVEGLSFHGSNDDAVAVTGGTGFSLRNSEVVYAGRNGFTATSSPTALRVEGCSFTHSNNNGIEVNGVNGVQLGAVLRANTIRHTGLNEGMHQNENSKIGIGMNIGGDGYTIEQNTLDNTGNHGMIFSGNHILIKNNLIQNFNSVLDDGGGIYIIRGVTELGVNRTITGNIILNGIGALQGTDKSWVGSSGIYTDDKVHDLEVTGNTIANCVTTGVYVHNSSIITLRGNTLYNNGVQLSVRHDNVAPDYPVRSLNVKQNIFFSPDPSQYVTDVRSIKDDLNLMGSLDSNYHCRPLNEDMVGYTAYVSGGKTIKNVFDLKGWQTASVHDKNSRITARQLSTYRWQGFSGTNRVSNGTMERDISGYYTNLPGTMAWVSGKLDGGTLQASVPATATNYSVSTVVGAITAGKRYLLRFSVQSERDTVLAVMLKSGSVHLTPARFVKMSPTRRDYEFLVEPATGGEKPSLTLATNAPGLRFWVDNLLLQEAEVTMYDASSLYRFEYNASPAPKTVTLDGNYVDIRCKRYTGTLSLAPYSSVILLHDTTAMEVKPNVAPTVTLNSPTADTQHFAPATISVSATAKDPDGSIAKVEFFSGSTLIGTATQSPYSIQWNNVAAGNYSLTAKATDDKGLSTVSATVSVTVKAVVPNQAPTVSLTSPLAGSSFTAPATISVSATAKDPDGSIAKVEFFSGSTLIGTATQSPYSIQWNNVAAGNYSLTAKATDDKGLSTVSATVSVTVKAVVPNQAPTVSLTSPLAGSSFTAPATISVSATAKDPDGSIAKVEFFSGSTLIGTATQSPYSIQWNNVAAGNYSLTAKATDDKGLSTVSATVSVTVKAVVPNQAPTVSLTSPLAGSSFTAPATISVSATAKDPDGSIAKVEFFSGSTLIGTATQSPYSIQWNNVAAGNYSLTAKATDDKGLSTVSATVSVTVKAVVPNQAPTVSLTSPLAGSSFTAPATISVSATAKDPDGSIAKVEFFSGSTLIGTATQSPYSIQWNNVAAGNYSLTAKATDDKGLSTVSATVSVTVKAVVPNQAPTVSLTSPLAGSSFTAPATVTVSASAQDPDGSIAKVEFFSGSTLIGTATQSPYSIQWNNVAAGNYSLTAKATDDKGLSTVSATVSVTVKAVVPNQAPTVSLTSPLAGSSFTAPATISVSATAKDPDGSIAKVEFFSGSTLIGTATQSPYSIQWNNVAAGNYSLTAKATDDKGLSTVSATVSVTVKAVVPNQAPTVSLTSPLAGSSFTAPATISVSATAKDPDGSIAKVEFFSGSTLIGTATQSPYSIQWNNVAAGNYSLTAKATDDKGLSTVSATVSVTVKAVVPNQAPTVSLTSPLAGSSFTAPATVTVSASAQDSDGSIAKVEFFSGSTLIGTATQSPYSIQWNNVAAGNYSLTAKATDDKGLSSISAPAVLKIRPAPNKPVEKEKIIQINFQDSAAKTPAGWLSDFGQPFAERSSARQGNGHTYGWIALQNKKPLDLRSKSRLRRSTADSLLATLVHMQGKGAPVGLWEAQIENGTYEVTVCVGDNDYLDSRHTVAIEGVTAIKNFNPTANVKFKKAKVTVTVTDGRLTVDPIGGSNTKLNYIIIRSLVDAGAAQNGASGEQKIASPTLAEKEDKSAVLTISKVYPNPSNNYFNLMVQGSSDTVVTMYIYNFAGVLLETRTGIAANSTIQAGGQLARGTYLVRMQQGTKSAETKITKM